MADSRPLHHRLAGLQPDALMAQGLPEPGPPAVEPAGVVLEAPLGRGGMGTVYLARQISLDREVAVKVLASELAHDPLFLERLEREARVMARLRHPNIVAVYDFQSADTGAAIVMEFVEGGSLREKLREHPQGLPVAEALRLVRQIASGLAAAHAAGVIHRDVKPENVLLDRHGTARVTDFGVALPLSETARLTLTGTTVGTLDYMAPEQLQNGPLDARLDLFALGVIAYELLTGQIPRGSFDPPHRRRPEVARHLSDAVMRALRPIAAERHVNVEAFLAALDGGPKTKRLRWLALLGVAAVVTLAALTLWPARERPTLPTPSTEPQPGPWRDAIAGTHIYQDVISGDWTHEKGVLTSNAQICLVRLEAEMPPAYDVRLRFTRLGGRDSVALFFTANESVGSAELDAWREGLAGVQSIGGESLRSGYGFRHSLENGRPCEMLVEVRPAVVRISVDGTFRKEFAIGTQRLGVVSEWEWNPVDRPAALAVGTYLSPTRFELIEWRPVGTPPTEPR